MIRKSADYWKKVIRDLGVTMDEVLLTATAQNLRRLVKLLCSAPPPLTAACTA